MPQQIPAIDPSWPIVPGEGLGPLALGLPLFYLRKAFLDSYRVGPATIDPAHPGGWSGEIAGAELELLVIRADEGLDIVVNTFLGKVCALRAREGYRGRLWEAGGVGSRAGSLDRECRQRGLDFVELCEGQLYYVLPDARRFSLSLEVGGDDEDGVFSDAHWEELMNRPVRAIEIGDDRLRSPMGAYDLPSGWEKSRPDRIGLPGDPGDSGSEGGQRG